MARLGCLKLRAAGFESEWRHLGIRLSSSPDNVTQPELAKKRPAGVDSCQKSAKSQGCAQAAEKSKLADVTAHIRPQVGGIPPQFPPYIRATVFSALAADVTFQRKWHGSGASWDDSKYSEAEHTRALLPWVDGSDMVPLGRLRCSAVEHEAVREEPPREHGCVGIDVVMATSKGSRSALAPVNLPRFWNGRGFQPPGKETRTDEPPAGGRARVKSWKRIPG